MTKYHGEPERFELTRYGIDGEEIPRPGRMSLWAKVVYTVVAALLFPIVAAFLNDDRPR